MIKQMSTQQWQNRQERPHNHTIVAKIGQKLHVLKLQLLLQQLQMKQMETFTMKLMSHTQCASKIYSINMAVLRNMFQFIVIIIKKQQI